MNWFILKPVYLLQFGFQRIRKQQHINFLENPVRLSLLNRFTSPLVHLKPFLNAALILASQNSADYIISIFFIFRNLLKNWFILEPVYLSSFLRSVLFSMYSKIVVHQFSRKSGKIFMIEPVYLIIGSFGTVSEGNYKFSVPKHS